MTSLHVFHKACQKGKSDRERDNRAANNSGWRRIGTSEWEQAQSHGIQSIQSQCPNDPSTQN
ncbi:hypothetical protein EXN66_Car011066 [Channa argus]|uniref:Uncharacterized protein n=1 Tax=Channa argus TaxID=215402 RepID=A0A6G1PYI0_CHAAH|nr:hypothetical protein EXN66_Car011066 [Channa argus]